MAFETPWFLKSKTTEVGRANQIVEERLQRSVTNLQFKARRSLVKIDRRIDTIIEEYKNITDDVDFTTDLDQHGKPLDPEEARSKSSKESRSKRKLKGILNKGSQSAHTGYKIRQRKEKHRFSTQELIDKLTKMKEKEEVKDWDLNPQFKMPSRVYKLKPIEGVTNKLPLDVTDGCKIKEDTDNAEYTVKVNGVIDEDPVFNDKSDVDLKLIGVVKEANDESGASKKKVKRRKKKDKKKTS